MIKSLKWNNAEILSMFFGNLRQNVNEKGQPCKDLRMRFSCILFMICLENVVKKCKQKEGKNPLFLIVLTEMGQKTEWKNNNYLWRLNSIDAL